MKDEDTRKKGGEGRRRRVAVIRRGGMGSGIQYLDGRIWSSRSMKIIE